ncbi:MAG: hypothetical protein ACM3N4_05740 [Nitrososphaerota archaeon]
MDLEALATSMRTATPQSLGNSLTPASTDAWLVIGRTVQVYPVAIPLHQAVPHLQCVDERHSRPSGIGVYEP